MIITVVGGGSTFTPGIVKSIAQRAKELDLDEIRLFDIDKERQDKVAVVVEWILREDVKTDVKLTVTNDEKEAYTDATFIFAQMRVGKYEMREQDEKIPLKHGCVGQETCGCGGMAYGLRTINPMIKVIDDVEKYAKKDHWILNYSNPAAIVSEACRKLRPNARIINICDMPIAIIDMVAESLNIKDVNNIRYDYFGLNHFGWFTSIDYKGRDLLAEIKEYIKENKILLPQSYIERIKKAQSVGHRHAVSSWNHVWSSVHTMLESFPEYLPNTYLTYYLLSKETVEHANPERTRANEVMESREKDLFEGVNKYLETGEIDEKTFYAGSHGDWISDLAVAIKNDTHARFLVITENEGVNKYLETGEIDEKTFYAGSHGDWISDLAVAIKNDTHARFLVITENRGAIPNMPYDAMVEVPAYIGKNGPEVIAMDPIPLFQQGDATS